MKRQLFNWTIFLAFSVGLTSCNGQIIKDLPMEKVSESIIITAGQPKLIKTQGSLEGDNVHCSLQDKAGNLWFGTTGEGVYKYDGKSFIQFTVTNGLNSNGVHCILEDKDANIWIGTDVGVCLYDGNTFTEVLIDPSIQAALPSGARSRNLHVFSIMQDKSGKLWFATVAGVYFYDGKSFTSFTVSEGGKGYMSSKNNVEYILEDEAGNIWFGGRVNEGVFRYDGKSVTNFKLEELNGHNWAWPVLQDKNGDIWFSNWGGAYRYDGKSQSAGKAAFTSFTSKDGLCNDLVVRIMEDSKGNLWFGSGGANGGICRYDNKSLSDGESGFTHYTTNDGLTHNGVWSILEDSAGNIWVGTRNTGLCRYDGESLSAGQAVFTSFSE